MLNKEINKLAKTVEEVNKFWCRYVDCCEAHALSWACSDMDTLNRIVKEKKRSPFVNSLLGGSSKEHNDWLLQMMIEKQEHENDAAQYGYDTYRLNYLYYKKLRRRSYSGREGRTRHFTL